MLDLTIKICNISLSHRVRGAPITVSILVPQYMIYLLSSLINKT